MTEYRLAVLASGEGSNLKALIDNVHRPGIASIALVVSDRERSGALAKAQNVQIPTLSLPPLPGEGRREYHGRMAVALSRWGLDLIVLAGYLRLLPAEFIRELPPIINVHPSLLPAFPGLEAPAQALAYGAKVSGCTVHLVDEGMDTGPIICQQALPILPKDTAQVLHERIKALEHRMLTEVVKAFALGRVKICDRTIVIEEDKDEA